MPRAGDCPLASPDGGDAKQSFASYCVGDSRRPRGDFATTDKAGSQATRDVAVAYKAHLSANPDRRLSRSRARRFSARRSSAASTRATSSGGTDSIRSRSQYQPCLEETRCRPKTKSRPPSSERTFPSGSSMSLSSFHSRQFQPWKQRTRRSVITQTARRVAHQCQNGAKSRRTQIKPNTR